MDDKAYQITLNNVLYALDSPYNLISTTHLTAAGGSVLQKGNWAKVKSPDGTIKIIRIKAEGLANPHVVHVKVLDKNSAAEKDQSYIS